MKNSVMKERKLFRKIQVVHSVLAIVIMLFDYYLTDEFKMKGAFVLSAVIGMILNIVRILKDPLFQIKWLRHCLDIVLFIFLIYCLTECFFRAFTHGFGGGNNPFILDITAVLIFTFGCSTYFAIIQEIFPDKKRNSSPSDTFLSDDTLRGE